MVQFFTVIISLYLFSHAYNVLLVLTFPASKQFTINSEMGVTNSRYVFFVITKGSSINDATAVEGNGYQGFCNDLVSKVFVGPPHFAV